MALINCPECQHQVSEIAKACPNCGAKVQKILKKKIKAEKKIIAKQRNKKVLKYLSAFACAYVVLAIIVVSSNGNKRASTTNITLETAEPTRADQSRFNSNILLSYTSEGLTKADLAWHALGYGWDCSEVASKSEMTKEGYFFINCSNGKIFRVYPRPGKHPRVTNRVGTYKNIPD